MKKLKTKILISSIIAMTLLGTITSSFVMVAESQENSKIEEVIEDASLDLSKIEEVNINEAEDIEKAGEYTLTSEDEARIDKATNEYLKMVKYNPRLRGFVAAVIDIALIAIGVGSGIRTGKAVMLIINANRTNITRVVKKQISARIGIGIGGAISLGLDKATRRYDGYILA